MFRFHKLLFTTFLAVLTGCKTSVSHNPLMESAGSFYSEKENKVFLHNSTITKEQTEHIELTQFSRKSQNVLYEHQLPTVQKLKNNKIFFNQNKHSPIKFKITQKISQNSKKLNAETDPMNVSLLASYNMLMDLGLLIMLISSLYLGIIGLFTNEGKSANEMFLVLIFWGFGFLGLGFILWLIGLLHFKYTQKQKLKKKSVK